MKRLLSIGQSAEYCGMGITSFRDVVMLHVRPVRILAGKLLFDLYDLDRYIDTVKGECKCQEGSGDIAPAKAPGVSTVRQDITSGTSASNEQDEAGPSRPAQKTGRKPKGSNNGLLDRLRERESQQMRIRLR